LTPLHEEIVKQEGMSECAPDDGSARLAHERDHEHPLKRKPFRIPVVCQANGHVNMACPGLGPIGAENPIPPGKIKPVVAVCFPDYYRMMDTVHIGSDHQQPQHPVSPEWYEYVAVIEH